MTLTQLRYLIAIAENGSISSAANNIYASQSNLSIAMHDLEREFGIEIFTRSNRGVTLTNEGTELLAYARQVVEQADMLEHRFGDSETPAARRIWRAGLYQHHRRLRCARIRFQHERGPDQRDYRRCARLSQ